MSVRVGVGGRATAEVTREALLPGAAAGLAGGVVLGSAQGVLGTLGDIAVLVAATSATVGFVALLVVSMILGALFGALLRYQVRGFGETLAWGMAYGLMWWYFGALTAMPLLSGKPVTWTVQAAQEAFQHLPGYLLYGVTTGLALAWLRRGDREGSRPAELGGSALRGLVAGAAAVGLIVAAFGRSHDPIAAAAMARPSPGAAAMTTLALGLLAGLGYGLLYPRSSGWGICVVRGVGYGFLLWVLVGLTVVPLVERGGLAWSAQDARQAFSVLPALLLFGAALAYGHAWLAGARRVLFGSPAERAAHEAEDGTGARTLRAVGRGVVAGIAGGALFTVVMVQIGFLGTVARLVGSGSAIVGLIVHMCISIIVGMSYGLLFRRQTHDITSALGWGTAYGLLWWVLGGLTILPVWLGGEPQWSAAAAARAFPSLVGHLCYGAGLGVAFHVLEARHDPWWVPRVTAYAERSARRRAYLHSAAPAIWITVVLLTLTVTVVLGE